MNSFGRFVVGSAAVAFVVIGSAVGCLMGAAALNLGGVIPLVQLSCSERATGDEARITKNQMHNER